MSTVAFAVTSPRGAHQKAEPRDRMVVFWGGTGQETRMTPALLRPLVERALQEDLSTGGDLTTEAVIDATTRATATAVARHDVVVCGGDVLALAFQLVDPTVGVEVRVADGERAATGTVIWRIDGAARSLLSAERVALNFVQRMMGTATESRRYVDALTPGSRTRIADTRKTTPGLRLLERYAVRTGGAHNHRDNLATAVMIKDNHIVASGGSIAACIERARARVPHTARIEVEVDTLEQLDEALAAGADIVLLDNMSNETVAEAIRRADAAGPTGRGRPLLEASGGITLERVSALSALATASGPPGVDVISVGALTHSAAAADVSLDFAFSAG